MGCFISLDFIIFYHSSRSLNTPTITFNGSHLIFTGENKREINLSPKAMCPFGKIVCIFRFCVAYSENSSYLLMVLTLSPRCLTGLRNVSTIRGSSHQSIKRLGARLFYTLMCGTKRNSLMSGILYKALVVASCL